MALTTFGGFDDVFGPLFGSTASFPLSSAMATAGRDQPSVRGMALDVVEKKDQFEIKADVPGVSKQDINLNVDADVLSISVDKVQEKEEPGEEGTKWHRSERSRMWARRSVRLPETARLDAIKAKYHDGVLTVAVPKDEKKLESRAIDIE